MHKTFLITASVMGMLAVALGAFGAHALKKIVPPETVTTFETGVRYQFYHSFALLIVAIIFSQFNHKFLSYSGNCFIAGIILFSGSLYLLTILKATNTVGVAGIGAITPLGGLFFIAGWFFMLLAVLKK
jgi:uncharacterized membrane protein YgdD (TMEM256/DUF423 family)